MYSCLAKLGLGQGLTRFFFLFSLYLPAGRQVLNILPACFDLRARMAGRSILSKKRKFLYYRVVGYELQLVNDK